MKTVDVSELQGGEYLAKPVILSNNQILFYEGTCLYMKHIETLVSAQIQTVDIFEPTMISPKAKIIIREELKNDCSSKVKTVLDSRINTGRDDLREIENAANEIISDIYEREEVIDRVYDIRERNADLYEHSVMVATLSIMMALKLNMPQADVSSIGIGCLLHDMGLRYLTIGYENIDLADFSPDELFEYKKHTLYGFASVEKENWMSTDSKKIILLHHEKLNGMGYPFCQKNIPLCVRIVSVVDTFDDRLCGIGCNRTEVREVLSYLRRYRDIFFDGRVVDSFLDMIAAYPVGTYVNTNYGDVAVVLEQNEHYSERPIIRLIKDKDGKEYDREIIVNLIEDNDVNIISSASKAE